MIHLTYGREYFISLSLSFPDLHDELADFLLVLGLHGMESLLALFQLFYKSLFDGNFTGQFSKVLMDVVGV